MTEAIHRGGEPRPLGPDPILRGGKPRPPGPPQGAGGPLAEAEAVLAGHAPLPRDGDELVFEEPWQGRALGMGVVAVERSGASWDEFRRHLVAAVRRHPHQPDESAATAYYTAWLDALEALLAERGLLPAGPRHH
ncbi:MAG TPA: nitrile hydratase accessory protein [Actinomycetota bacterium]|jgi:nitrile hydratase accessory protein|nr:nitrile hydratase accessory protein [Actinomycetota bacterium]